jgi:hypothetical protein
MLYIRALEKVLNEKDMKRSQYAQAKRVCDEALRELKFKSGLNYLCSSHQKHTDEYFVFNYFN